MLSLVKCYLTCGVDLNMLYKGDVNDENFVRTRGSGLYYE